MEEAEPADPFPFDTHVDPQGTVSFPWVHAYNRKVLVAMGVLHTKCPGLIILLTDPLPASLDIAPDHQVPVTLEYVQLHFRGFQHYVEHHTIVLQFGP